MFINKNKKAFTLIELLIVCTILAILTVVIVVGYSGAKAKSRDSKRIVDMNSIASALTVYYDVNKYYAPDPVTYDTSKGTGPDNNNITGGEWTGGGLKTIETAGYISKLPLDPINSGNYYYLYEPATNGDSAQFGITCPSDTSKPCAYMLSAKFESSSSKGYDAGCDTSMNSEHNYCIVDGGAKVD